MRHWNGIIRPYAPLTEPARVRSKDGDAEKCHSEPVKGLPEGVALRERSDLGVASHSSSAVRRAGVLAHSPSLRSLSLSLPLPLSLSLSESLTLPFSSRLRRSSRGRPSLWRWESLPSLLSGSRRSRSVVEAYRPSRPRSFFRSAIAPRTRSLTPPAGSSRGREGVGLSCLLSKGCAAWCFDAL